MSAQLIVGGIEANVPLHPYFSRDATTCASPSPLCSLTEKYFRTCPVDCAYASSMVVAIGMERSWKKYLLRVSYPDECNVNDVDLMLSSHARSEVEFKECKPAFAGLDI